MIGYVAAIHVAADPADLEHLWPEWDELLAESDAASVFLTSAWLRAWVETLGATAEIAVAVAREPESGRLTGVAPFAVVRRNLGITQRTLVFLGQGRAAPDHLDLIVRRHHEHLAPQLWSAALRHAHPDAIDLDGVRTGSMIADIVLRRRGDAARHATATPAPVLDLPTSWDAYLGTLGRNLRHNLGRYGRKLDREAPGPVIERMVTDPSEITETIDRLGDLHQDVRTARGDRGVFAEARLRAFHRRAALQLHESGRLRLHRLDVGDRMIAGIYCMRHRDTVAFYTTGYDQEYGAYGPGRRIMATAIRSAIDEGASRFDFLRGDEAYKYQWGARPAEVLRLRRPVVGRGRLLWTIRELVRGGTPASRRQ